MPCYSLFITSLLHDIAATPFHYAAMLCSPLFFLRLRYYAAASFTPFFLSLRHCHCWLRLHASPFDTLRYIRWCYYIRCHYYCCSCLSLIRLRFSLIAVYAAAILLRHAFCCRCCHDDISCCIITARLTLPPCRCRRLLPLDSHTLIITSAWCADTYWCASLIRHCFQLPSSSAASWMQPADDASPAAICLTYAISLFCHY